MHGLVGHLDRLEESKTDLRRDVEMNGKARRISIDQSMSPERNLNLFSRYWAVVRGCIWESQ